MKNIRRLDMSLIRRPASYRGPRSSEDWTSSIDEIVRDLSELSNQWNAGVIPLLTTLPDGSDDSDVDAFTNGIDGRTIYVDSALTSSSAITTYWHATKERPKAVKEALDDLYSYIDEQITSVQTDVSTASGPLTAEQKAAIGSNIFDPSASSTSTSLDGKSENNRQNIIQLAKDLYGTGYSLGADGVADLTYSVMQMVDALLEAHGGNWNSDIDLLHSGINLIQTDVASSVVVNDSFGGAPTNAEEDFNQVRTQIKTYAGGAAWTTSMPALYGGGATTLKALLDSTAGSASKSATNPWGYHYDDVDGLGAVLDALRDFIGQGTHTDSSPAYSSTIFISDGNSLETSVGDLDAAVGAISGIVPSGFPDLIDTPSSYVGNSGQIVHVNGTETGLEFASAHFREDGVLESPYDIEVTESGQGFVVVDSGNTRWRLNVDIYGVPIATVASGEAPEDVVTIMSSGDMSDDAESDLLDISHIKTVGFQFTSDGGSTHAGLVYFRLTNDPLVSGIVMEVPIVPVSAGLDFTAYREIHNLASKYIDAWYHPTAGGTGETLTITAYRKYP